mgnify:CR=1 FL=1
MPLGLPSHLAARTTTRAVARAGHAIAAVSLVSVGIVGLSVEVSLPEVALWPADRLRRLRGAVAQARAHDGRRGDA